MLDAAPTRVPRMVQADNFGADQGRLSNQMPVVSLWMQRQGEDRTRVARAAGGVSGQHVRVLDHKVRLLEAAVERLALADRKLEANLVENASLCREALLGQTLTIQGLSELPPAVGHLDDDAASPQPRGRQARKTRSPYDVPSRAGTE
jgi:hypothetical protein